MIWCQVTSRIWDGVSTQLSTGITDTFCFISYVLQFSVVFSSYVLYWIFDLGFAYRDTHTHDKYRGDAG